MDILKSFTSKKCECGKDHSLTVDNIIVEEGAIARLPEIVAKYGKKPFIVADPNTYAAAASAVCDTLKESGLPYSVYVFSDERPEPDEQYVGSAIMHFDTSCDVILGVGSGVINDICKILANVTDLPYVIFATAPSMDGYASATSSVAMDGLKVSLPSRCACTIVADVNILKNAPMRLLWAGLGDMLAKYVAICEWRIASVVVGEYYCPRIADLVLDALEACVSNADGLLRRETDAVKAVFEGLVISGVAMNLAGCSRPASGVEHYYSHVWDMRGLEFGTPVDLHGIQCAIGTKLACEKYEFLRTYSPDRARALNFAKGFDKDAWNAELREFFGKGAEAMIALEAKERKYDIDSHQKRLEVIIGNWDRIVDIINTLPTSADIDKILDKIGAPKSCEEIGIDKDIIDRTFASTKDIRDKYVLSRLYWDLGLL